MNALLHRPAVDALVLLFGACIGSFLNVVIARVPKGESIVRPGSHCACGQPLAWRDNIPILSWILLRGRARCCGRPISLRYPVVEALTAGLFLACWRLFPPLPAACGWIFVSALIAGTGIDLEHMIIPDLFTVGLALAGLALAVLVPSAHGQTSGYFALDALRSLIVSLEGMLLGAGLVVWVATLAEILLKKEAMGFGDVKLAGAIGAFCGWRGAVFALFGGAVIGSVALIVVLIVWKARRGKPTGAAAPIGFGTEVPFGPMLAAAGALYFLGLHGPVDRWFEHIAQLL